MKIKQLELKGFKSFRNQTRIRFEEGISCIVGPNGCGKSNIVDAFLWVMGESAPKRFRSKAMEDVIFAGAGELPPAGRAEVSLIMEKFPTSASKSKEIMVTRRLNRDGLSEYLINSRPARLKDVQEVFMDTGVGVHGFSLIEQGAIENFISSRPEQKKQMVESAAGIARFRFRKKSAERKLELTENNLNRLQDLLTRQEIDLKKLKKQSETAQKFKSLKVQAQTIEQHILAWDLKQIKTEENHLSQVIKTKIKTQNKLSHSSDQLSLKAQALNEERKQVRKEQSVLREEQAHLESQLIPLEKELAGKATSLKIQKDRLLSFSKPSAHSQNIFLALKEKKDQISEEEQTQKKLQQKWQSLKKEEESTSAKLSRFHAEKEKLLRQVGEAGHHKTLLEQTIHLLEEKLKEQDFVLEQLKTRHGQNAENTQRLLSKQKALKEQKEKSRQMNFDMGELIEKEKSHIQTLKQEIFKEKEGLKHLREKETILYSEWQSLKKRKALEGEDKAKAFLLSQQAEAFQDIAQAIELASPFLEKAVSSFLSERLKSLFALKAETAISALKELQEKHQGACRFVLPIEEGQGPFLDAKARIKQAPGFQYFLEDKAKGQKALIRALFSKIAVLDNLTTALKLKKTYPDWGFITLEGEVISPEGDLIKPSFDDHTNILWHKDLENAPLRYETVKKQRLTKEASLRKKEEMGQKLSHKVTNLSHKEHSFEIQAFSIKKDLESLSQSTGLMLKEKAKLEQEQKEVQDKQKALEGEHKALIEKLKILSQKSPNLQKSQESLKSAEKEQEKAQQAISMRREKLWQEILLCETKSVRLKEQKSLLLKEKEQLKWDEEQRALKKEELKASILKEEKALIQQEKQKQALSQKIKAHLAGINQLSIKENTLESQKEQAETDIQQVRSEMAEQDRALNKLKLNRESLLLKKEALINSASLAEGDSGESRSCSSDFDRDKAEEELNKINRAISRVGELNFLALKEYESLMKEHQFYQKQYEDLKASKEKLFKVINRIDSFCSKKFKEVFEEVRGRFSKLWPSLFEGGKADLVLISSEQGEEGLEVKVQPPGKKIQNMSLLSGGEKAMTAVAMMVSLFLVKPSPFCILDEVDAPLDDNNVTRFKALLSEMARLSQIILVTHNKQSMKEASVLYGVTMEEKGISQVMSLKPTQMAFPTGLEPVSSP